MEKKRQCMSVTAHWPQKDIRGISEKSMFQDIFGCDGRLNKRDVRVIFEKINSNNAIGCGSIVDKERSCQ